MKQMILPIILSLFIFACNSETMDGFLLDDLAGEQLVVTSVASKAIASADYKVKNVSLTTNINEDDRPQEAIQPHQNTSLSVILKNNAKEIKDGIFQSIVLETTEDGELISTNFYTWINDKSGVNIIDVTHYNDDKMAHGNKIGQYYYELWKEKNSFFLSYNDLLLEKDFLQKAENGYMYNSNISIGTTKDDLITILGPPTISDWYHGGTHYVYNDISFILDDSKKVVSISMPGNRIKTTLEEVPIILGAPTSVDHFEKYNAVFYSYELEQYTLSFEAVSENDKVVNIWLNKK